MSLANDNLFVIYGAWLESSHNLSLAAIGFGTIFIGLSEVLGEGFSVFFSFEFTVVTSMSLSTELVPQLRASTMSAFFAFAGIGRVIGAFSGGIIWSKFGLLGISLISGICTLAALGSLLIGFHKN